MTMLEKVKKEPINRRGKTKFNLNKDRKLALIFSKNIKSFQKGTAKSDSQTKPRKAQKEFTTSTLTL